MTLEKALNLGTGELVAISYLGDPNMHAGKLYGFATQFGQDYIVLKDENSETGEVQIRTYPLQGARIQTVTVHDWEEFVQKSSEKAAQQKFAINNNRAARRRN